MRPSVCWPAQISSQVSPRTLRYVLAGAILIGLPFPALAQSTAGNVINDRNYPPGFDCNSLGTPKAKLDCQTVQSDQTQDSVPPGTPAIPMPGEPNVMQDPNQHGVPPNNYNINNFIRGKGNSNR